MKILVACEYSGVVRDAFAAKGWDAWSCDLLPTERPGQHYQCDVREVMGKGWDMMIAFPPCTDLCVSGAKHFAAKRADGRQQSSIEFFMLFANSGIPRVAIENPVGIMSRHWRKPDQIVQPFHFGHEARKPTCLWLKNLPMLRPTKIVGQGEIHTTKGGNRLPKWYNLPPSKDRWKIRSATFQGLADAMADQWSEYALNSRTNAQRAQIAENLFAWSASNTTQNASVSATTTQRTTDGNLLSARESSMEFVNCEPDAATLAYLYSRMR
jgi:hypothetical protein